jgi:hypothetical protein
LTDRKEIWRRLLATLIKPMVTAEWWQKEMDVLAQIVQEVPCYSRQFVTTQPMRFSCGFAVSDH